MMRARPRHTRLASIGDLARVSLRMQLLFVVTLIIAIVMLVMCYWVVNSLINLATNEARSHFQHLILNLHGQESLIARATRSDAVRLAWR